MGVAMVGMGWGSAFSATASDGRDVFRDDHWAVLGLECMYTVVSYGQSWIGIYSGVISVAWALRQVCNQGGQR
jgi:hypothetical protein